MKRIPILLILFVPTLTLFAQDNTKPIETFKNSGEIYHQGDKKLKMRDLVKLTREVPAAQFHMKKATTNYTLSSVIDGIGGFLLGYQLGVAIGGGEPNWAVAGIGGGLIGVSIPFALKSSKQTADAVKEYNANLTGYNPPKKQLHFLVNARGVGFAYQF